MAPFLCSPKTPRATPRSHLEKKSKSYISISASSFKAPGHLALGPGALKELAFLYLAVFIYFSCQTDDNYSLCTGICHHFLDGLYFPHSPASSFFSTLAPPRLPPFSHRVRLAGMKISRPPTSVGHYKMVKHRGDKGNEENPHR